MGKTKPETLKRREPEETLTIDEEFKNLNPLKSKISNMFLERELQEKGFDSLHPIVIWAHNGKEIIVDGYNRNFLSQKLGISYYTVEKEFESRAEVRAWIKNNQDSHRSLSPLVERYKLGAYYNSLKQKQGGDKKSKPKQASFDFKSTAHQLAEELGVDHSTIETAGRHAKTVDEYVKNTHRRYYEIINLIEKDKNVSFRSFDIIAQVKSEAQEDFVNKLETETEVSLKEFVKQFPQKPDLKKPKEKKDKAPVQGTKKIDNPQLEHKIDSAPIIETEVPIKVSAPPVEPVVEPIIEHVVESDNDIKKSFDAFFRKFHPNIDPETELDEAFHALVDDFEGGYLGVIDADEENRSLVSLLLTVLQCTNEEEIDEILPRLKSYLMIGIEPVKAPVGAPVDTIIQSEPITITVEAPDIEPVIEAAIAIESTKEPITDAVSNSNKWHLTQNGKSALETPVRAPDILVHNAYKYDTFGFDVQCDYVQFLTPEERDLNVKLSSHLKQGDYTLLDHVGVAFQHLVAVYEELRIASTQKICGTNLKPC